MRTQFAALFGARVAGAILQAAGFVVLARAAGVLEFGQIGIVLGVGLFSATIADLGMTTLLARSRALGLARDVAVGIRLNALTTAVLGVVATAILLLLAGDGRVAWGLVGLGLALAIEKNVETALSVPIADGEKSVVALSVVLRRGATLLFLGALLALRAEPALAYSIAYVASGGLGQLQIRRYLRRAVTEPHLRWSELGPVMRRGTPFLISNVTSQVRSLDTSMLGLLAAPLQIGLYAAVSRLTTPVLLIPGTLTALVVPHVARRDRAGSQRLGRQLIGGFLVTLVPIGVMAMFATEVMGLLFGARYAVAGPTLAVTLLSLPFVALSSPLGSVLQSQQHERFVAFNGLVFAGVLLAAMALGSSAAGSIGLAFGVGLTYLLKCIPLALRIRRLVDTEQDKPVHPSKGSERRGRTGRRARLGLSGDRPH